MQFVNRWWPKESVYYKQKVSIAKSLLGYKGSALFLQRPITIRTTYADVVIDEVLYEIAARRFRLDAVVLVGVLGTVGTSKSVAFFSLT